MGHSKLGMETIRLLVQGVGSAVDAEAGIYDESHALLRSGGREAPRVAPA